MANTLPKKDDINVSHRMSNIFYNKTYIKKKCMHKEKTCMHSKKNLCILVSKVDQVIVLVKYTESNIGPHCGVPRKIKNEYPSVLHLQRLNFFL